MFTPCVTMSVLNYFESFSDLWMRKSCSNKTPNHAFKIDFTNTSSLLQKILNILVSGISKCHVLCECKSSDVNISLIILSVTFNVICHFIIQTHVVSQY